MESASVRPGLSRRSLAFVIVGAGLVAGAIWLAGTVLPPYTSVTTFQLEVDYSTGPGWTKPGEPIRYIYVDPFDRALPSPSGRFFEDVADRVQPGIPNARPLAGYIRDRVEWEVDRDDRRIDIGFTHQRRDFAREVANTIAAVYQDYLDTQRVEAGEAGIAHWAVASFTPAETPGRPSPIAVLVYMLGIAAVVAIMPREWWTAPLELTADNWWIMGLGAAGVAVFATADLVGYGYPGLGAVQFVGLVASVGVFLAGLFGVWLIEAPAAPAIESDRHIIDRFDPPLSHELRAVSRLVARVPRRSVVTALAVILLATGVLLLARVMARPPYEAAAEAVISFEHQGTLEPRWQMAPDLDLERDLLLSAEVAQRVESLAAGIERSGFVWYEPGSCPEPCSMAPSAVGGALQIGYRPRSNLIRILYRHDDPVMARIGANLVLEVYQERVRQSPQRPRPGGIEICIWTNPPTCQPAPEPISLNVSYAPLPTHRTNRPAAGDLWGFIGAAVLALGAAWFVSPVERKVAASSKAG